MEFVFESDIKRGATPASPDILATPGKFSSRENNMNQTLFGSGHTDNSQRRKERRRLPESYADIEFNEIPKKIKKKTVGPKVSYVKPLKKRKVTKLSRIEWSWTKLGWLLCGLLVLRLIFMESGLLDYYSMHKTLENKQNTLELIRIENAELIEEIHKIKTSPRYQKKLARDHLGVIANDEYLILFSREAELSSSI